MFAMSKPCAPSVLELFSPPPSPYGLFSERSHVTPSALTSVSL